MTHAEKLDKRIQELEEWLKNNITREDVLCDQKHLDNGTQAQVYWHYGYLMALKDARKLYSQ